MSLSVILAFAVGLLALYILFRVFTLPVRIFWKLLYNGILGGILLWLFNLAGSLVGFKLAITPITALIAGFFGLPGVVSLVLYQLFTH